MVPLVMITHIIIGIAMCAFLLEFILEGKRFLKYLEVFQQYALLRGKTMLHLLPSRWYQDIFCSTVYVCVCNPQHISGMLLAMATPVVHYVLIGQLRYTHHMLFGLLHKTKPLWI